MPPRPVCGAALKNNHKRKLTAPYPSTLCQNMFLMIVRNLDRMYVRSCSLTVHPVFAFDTVREF
jgi:hypothetical protein